MDPTTAIGVAAAVVQFVDFGTRLVVRARQIYASPDSRTAQESQLLLSLSELRDLAAQAKDTFNRYPEVQSDRHLAGIYDDVENAAQEFDDILKGLKSRDKRKGKLKSIGTGYESIKTEKQVRQVIGRLEYIRRRGYSFTLSALWYFYLAIHRVDCS